VLFLAKMNEILFIIKSFFFIDCSCERMGMCHSLLAKHLCKNINMHC
jgi:hypothetical protein